MTKFTDAFLSAVFSSQSTYWLVAALLTGPLSLPGQAGTTTTPATEPLPTFIIAGQSNAYRLGSLAASNKGPRDGAPCYYYANPNCVAASKLNAMVVTLPGRRPPVRGMGTGIFQALAAEYPQGFALIRYAICGSDLHTQWRPGESTGYFQKYFKPFVNQGLTEIGKASGRKPTVLAVLWHQGEANAKDDTAVRAYPGQLTKLIGEMESFFGPVPFVMGEIRELPANPRSREVNRIMKSVTDGFPQAAVVGLQDVNWLPKGNVHLSQRGAAEAGRRLVKRAVELMATQSKEKMKN